MSCANVSDKSFLLLELLRTRVVPAVGCTEPIAVSLAVAKSRELLGQVPELIEIALSKNVLKNGMGVGIPGTGTTGLPIAAALGAVTGDSKDNLELLKNVTQEEVSAAKSILHRISLSKKENTDPLYIEVISKYNTSYSKVIIAKNHTNFVFLEKDGTVLQNDLDYAPVNTTTTTTNNNINNNNVDYSNIRLKDIYDFATKHEISELEFILESAMANRRAAEVGLTGNYGLMVSKNIERNIQQKVFSDDILSHALKLTTAAIDARMSGENVTIYSNSGSGDQGVTATLPVLAFYEKLQQTNAGASTNKNNLIRAIALSHLVAIYIKLKLGVLSPFCGVTTASIGAACGITFLLGGDYENMCCAIKNSAAGIIGMICDGAKNGCSIKVAAAVFSSINSATMGINNICPSSIEGIIHNDIEITIENIASIGRDGMIKVDDLVLEMMLSKS